MRNNQRVKCQKYPCTCTSKKQVVVTYGKGYSKPDQDWLCLCPEHADFVKKDAEQHGYMVEVTDL